jgi:D-serine deaminase-like pyridoxal phosphate-dependent protein
MREWYTINNVDQLDTPALAVYPERIKENIRILKEFVPDVNRLRPHVKTNKCAEVCQLMMDEGIYKFKCATIAEAEMLAGLKAQDVLLAYQPVGPKVNRLIDLVIKFPSTQFSCLVDDKQAASALSSYAVEKGIALPVYIDLNVGMNRTGILAEEAIRLYAHCAHLDGIEIIGIHAYDGHLRDTDLQIRKEKCDADFSKAEWLQKQIHSQYGKSLVIIAGGTPSFTIHAKREHVECSPGTFIFWDKGYQQILLEQPFVFAAIIVTRVISIPTPDIVTTDLGHKAIASESPIANRVYFLNEVGVEPIGHSEEHLVLKKANHGLNVGDVLYGVPHHICPTVALHETLAVIESNTYTQNWNVVSRKRKITV